MPEYISDLIGENNKLNKILCQIDPSIDKHIVSDPIKLPCDNLICLRCYETKADTENELICDLCSEQHKIGDCLKVNADYFEHFSKELKIAANKLFDKYQSNLKDVQSTIENKDVILDNWIEFLKNDVLIQHEKVKINLANSENSDKNLKNQSENDEIYKNLEIEYESLILKIENYRDQISNDFKILQNSFIAIKSQSDSLRVSEGLNNLELLSYLKSISDCIYKLKLIDHEFHLRLKNIYFTPSDSNSINKIGDVLENFYFKPFIWSQKGFNVKKLQNDIGSIEAFCGINNENLILVDKSNKRLVKLNKNFDICTTSDDLFQNTEFDLRDIIFDGNKTIFVTDLNERCVYAIDTNLSTKTHYVDTIVAQNISYFNNILYVLDYNGHDCVYFIKEYNNNVERLESTPLFGQEEYKPSVIRFVVKNNIIAFMCLTIKWLNDKMMLIDGPPILHLYDLQKNIKFSRKFKGAKDFYLNENQLIILFSNSNLAFYNLDERFNLTFHFEFKLNQVFNDADRVLLNVFNHKLIVSHNGKQLLCFD